MSMRRHPGSHICDPDLAGVSLGCGLGTPMASTSTMRLQLLRDAVTTTRIFVVVMFGNEKTRMALSLPVTLPPGIIVQAAPFQVCTWKSSTPSPVAGVFTVGSPAVVQLFCKV